MSRTSKTDLRLHGLRRRQRGQRAHRGGASPRAACARTSRHAAPRVQNDLFDVGADLCTPLQETYEYPPLRVEQAWVDELEADCDQYNAELEKLRSFILPGGTPGAAHLHVARTVARRAERSAWAAMDAYGDQPGEGDGQGGVNVLTAKYLNRLSDLLFILARVANLPIGGDVLWQPGGGREQRPGAGTAARRRPPTDGRRRRVLPWC